MTPADHHSQVAGRFTAVVDAVQDWDVPTPVAEWTARDVVRHLVAWLPELLAEHVTLPEGPSVDDDPAGAWRTHADAVQALLDQPQTAGRRIQTQMMGDAELGTVVDRFYTGDVFMHTWDLARATRQDDTLDSAACAQMLAGLRPMEQVIRDSGHFGVQMPVDDDASAQDQLIAFIGRDPKWAPEPGT